jgi:ribosome-associated toxin RatA of RatAB toxin-antitoxin module
VTASPVSVEIAAPPALVFRLARDPLRWATLLPHYSRSRLIRREPDGRVLASFVARRQLIGLLGLGVPVAWRSRTWTEPAKNRLHFHHVGGATDGMDATWRIEPIDGGCRVTIEHAYAPRSRLFAELIDRLFARPIAGRTLATFRALAESLTNDALTGESVEPPRTNPPT